MHLDERYQLHIKTLQGLFSRIEAAHTPDWRRTSSAFVAATIPYAGAYRESVVLRRLLDDCLQEYDSALRELKERRSADWEIVLSAARDCADHLQRTPNDRLDDSKRFQLMVTVQDAADLPEFHGMELQDVYNFLGQRCPDIVEKDALQHLREGSEKAFRRLEVDRRWFDALELSKPWGGARLIELFARAPSLLRAQNPTPREEVIAIFLDDVLLKGKSDFGKLPSLRIPHAFAAYNSLSRFHDWVTGVLLAGRVELDVFARHSARVARFEAARYREIIEQREPGSADDEEEFKNRLNLYLHDAGLDPMPEVPAGKARADAVVIAEPIVALEAKVLRPGEKEAKIRRRIQSGLRQALDYRRRFNLSLSHLVIFDAWDGGGMELPPSVEIEGAFLAIHHVELRESPTARPPESPVIRWSTNEVVEAALR